MNRRIHHVGYVVDEIQSYAASFPSVTFERQVFDPLQNAELALYIVDKLFRIEFIQPLSPDSFTWGFLHRRGAGLHHVCYEGFDKAAVEKIIREKKMLKLRGPMPAVLFGRDVVFAMTRQKAILEFLL